MLVEQLGPIHHLALPDDWAKACEAGEYRISTRGRSLATEGFIHCSFPHQVRGVAAAFYADIEELVLLTIDPLLLDAEVRVEDTTGGGKDFPHIYGPLPVAAVTDVRPYRATS